CSAHTCLRGPCGGYLGCISLVESDYADCISKISERPKCRSTGGGRCTIILGCVRACKQTRQIRRKACLKENLRDLGECAGCGRIKPRKQQSLARTCRLDCSNPTPTTSTSTTVSTTSTITSTSGATTSSTSSTTTTTGTTPPS